MKLPRNVSVGYLEIEFIQDGDSIEAGHQTLRVRLEDGGGGFFIVLETPRWSIDSPEELREILDVAQSLARELDILGPIDAATQ